MRAGWVDVSLSMSSLCPSWRVPRGISRLATSVQLLQQNRIHRNAVLCTAQDHQVVGEFPHYRELGLSAIRTAVHSPLIPESSTKVPTILSPVIFPIKNVFTCCPSGWLSVMVKARKFPSL